MELLGLDDVGLGLLADLGVRVHLCHQVGGVRTVGELDAEPVPDVEGVGGGGHQLGAQVRGPGQGGRAPVGKPAGPVAVEVGQGQRLQRGHVRRLPTGRSLYDAAMDLTPTNHPLRSRLAGDLA